MKRTWVWTLGAAVALSAGEATAEMPIATVERDVAQMKDLLLACPATTKYRSYPRRIVGYDYLEERCLQSASTGLGFLLRHSLDGRLGDSGEAAEALASKAHALVATCGRWNRTSITGPGMQPRFYIAKRCVTDELDGILGEFSRLASEIEALELRVASLSARWPQAVE